MDKKQDQFEKWAASNGWYWLVRQERWKHTTKGKKTEAELKEDWAISITPKQ